jgi:hypothetical protein
MQKPRIETVSAYYVPARSPDLAETPIPPSAGLCLSGQDPTGTHCKLIFLRLY